jgi:hypothetical protein
VQFLLPPVHARTLAVLALIDRLDLMLEWKRRLAGQAECAAFPIHDFVVLEPATMEPIAGRSLAATRFFWESSHFKKEHGAVLLSRVFRRKPDPAYLLGNGDVNSRNEKLRDAVLRYIGDNSPDVRRVRSLMQGAGDVRFSEKSAAH